ncbi:MAG: flp pilus-assembly TadE/G-like family protein [Actinomycetota bacterium]|nr:flp pilus-assembly TadE/G-like family protein [Actinomycetota bacterium]
MTPRDRGNGSVLSLGFMFAIAAAGLLVLVQVQAVIKTHAVQGAADLAAIAAAQAASDACTHADAVAEANRVRLVECTTQDDDFVVRVESDLPNHEAALLDFAHVQSAPIQASARAGFE